MLTLKAHITELYEACKLGMLAIERKEGQSFLTNCFHIRTESDGTYTVTSHNMAMCLSISRQGISAEEGSIVIPARTLTAVLSKLEKKSTYDTIIIEEHDGYQITCKAGRSKTHVSCIDPAKYFDIPSFPDVSQAITLDAEVFQHIHDNIGYCIGDDDKGVLANVLIRSTTQELKFVASDSHKLVEVVLPQQTPSQFDILLGRKEFDILKNLASIGNISFVPHNNHCFFFGNQYSLTILQTQGIFPQYEQFLTAKRPMHITCCRTDLLESVNIVQSITEDSNISKWEFNQDTLTLSSTRAQRGAIEEVLDIDYQGTPYTIGLNSKYMYTTLGHITNESVTLQFGTPTTPCKIVHTHDPLTITNILMPMRV